MIKYKYKYLISINKLKFREDQKSRVYIQIFIHFDKFEQLFNLLNATKVMSHEK